MSVVSRFEEAAKEVGTPVLCWRPVPSNNSMLGETAVNSEPEIMQVIGKKIHN